MVTKQLYNIETNTLITLIPEKVALEVKSNFTHLYHLDEVKFTIIYLLCLSHPYVVPYENFKSIIEDLGKEYPGDKKFDKIMSDYKKFFAKCGVKDLIIKVKHYGYSISNKWVPPQLHTEVSRKQRFLKIMKLATILKKV